MNRYMQSPGVVRLLRREVFCYGSQAHVAKNAGVSPQYIHDVLKGRREPSGKLLDYLGVERLTVYRRITKS